MICSITAFSIPKDKENQVHKESPIKNMEMKKYKVIALSVVGLGTVIHHSGEEVTEDMFLPGAAEQLVKGGFIQEVNSEGQESIVGEGLATNQEEGNPDPNGNEENSSLSETPIIDIHNTTQSEEEKQELTDYPRPMDTNIDTPEEGAKEDVPSIDNITKANLITDLRASNVEFDATASKKELYDLWLKR
jgi:hypothetical protein